jgi:hypothetical protein
MQVVRFTKSLPSGFQTTGPCESDGEDSQLKLLMKLSTGQQKSGMTLQMQWLALLLLPPPPFLLFSTCLFVSFLPVIVSHHPPTYLTTVCILVNKVHCGKYGVL